MTFQKDPPKETHYRDYKNFDREIFKEEIANKLNGQVNCHETLKQIFINILDKPSPLKKKVLKKESANQAPYMTKALRKAIMRRSQL